MTGRSNPAITSPRSPQVSTYPYSNSLFAPDLQGVGSIMAFCRSFGARLLQIILLSHEQDKQNWYIKRYERIVFITKNLPFVAS